MPRELKWTESWWFVALCIVGVAVYFGLGIVVVALLEPEWPVLDSIYFGITIIVTGTANTLPSNTSTKVFVMFFMFCTIFIAGFLLSFIGFYLITRQDKLLKEAKEAVDSLKSEQDDCCDKPVDLEDSLITNQIAQARDYGTFLFKSATSLNLPREPLYLSLAVGVLLAKYFLGAIILFYLIDLSFLDALYFSVVANGAAPSPSNITLIQDTGKEAALKLFEIFFVPFSSALGIIVLGIVADLVVRRQQEAFVRETIEDELEDDNFGELDPNADGKIDEQEFILVMLLKLKKVDEDLVEQLRSQYRKLDVDKSGFLETKDFSKITK